MRKVLFKKWIPKEIIGTDALRRIKQDTNCWEKDFTTEGLFHQWAFAYEEFETGPVNYTVALVELPNGEVIQVLPSNLKFEV
jgi:hypothetical protein